MMRSRTPALHWAVLSVALILLMAGTAYAQSGRGTIKGVVKDTTGAVMPGVAVTATNQGTNATTTATTNEEGLYSLLNLQLGTYSVEFVLQGFKPYRRDGITIDLGEIINLDTVLEVGGLEDMVTVTADTTLLETGNAEVGTTMQSEVVRDLPINVAGGRSILQFAYAITPSVEGEGKGNTWDSHIAGGAAFTNEVVVDGTSAVIQVGGWVGESSPPMESIEEFKVQTSGIAAEYGRTGGGVFNFTLKSGTNSLHGSAYGVLRREAFNSNTWQNKLLAEAYPERADEFEKPRDRRHVAGFSLGGPIIKDKTHFFVSVEDYKELDFTPGALNKTVPIPAFLNGDFSALLDTSGTPLGFDPAGNPIYPGAIRDPLTGNVFPGNVIPQDRLSRTSQQIADIYRQSYAPMADRMTNNMTVPQSGDPKYRQFQVMAKLNHRFSERSELVASFMYSRRPRTKLDGDGIWDYNDETGGPLALSRLQTVNAPQFRVSHNYTISPSMLNTVNFTFSRNNNPSESFSCSGNWHQELGLADDGVGCFPVIDFGDAVNGVGTSPIGQHHNNGLASNVWILSDSLNWVTGRHAFKFGGEYRHQTTWSWESDDALHFDFAPDTTRFLGQPWANQTGFGFASFMLGEVYQADRTTPNPLSGGRDYLALYVQDDFRVGDKLTLNLGLRWETSGPWHEKDGRWSNYNKTALNPELGVPGVIEFADSPDVTFEGDRNLMQFGPRIGLAYTPTERFVIRAAYGLFYEGVGMNYWFGVPYSYALGFRTTNVIPPAGGGVPVFNWDGGYPEAERPPSQDPNAPENASWWGQTTVSPESLDAGRLHQWNAGVEFAVTDDLVLGVNYLANRGIDLHNGELERNQPDTAALGDLHLRGQEWAWIWDEASAAAAGVPYPYPGFSNFSFMALTPYPQAATGWGMLLHVNSPLVRQRYNALEITANKRMSGGFAGHVAYTYARARGHNTTMGGFQESWSAGLIQDVTKLDMEADTIRKHDLTHVVKGYVAWELPFGQARRWLNSSGWQDALFGGWTVSLLFRYESGPPLRILSNNYYAGWNDYGYPIYVNADPNGNFSNQFDPDNFDIADPGSSGNRFFDPNSFSNPPYGEFGEGPGYFEQLRNHSRAYEDLGIMKSIGLGDRFSVQLRAEVINLFNRKYFGTPVTSIGDANFGNVIGLTGEPRKVQLWARLMF
jgi:hypothetical protein